jgi:hypothetical protein
MKRFRLLILGGFLLLGVSFAWADATIESTLKTGGFKGMGASEGTTTRRFQGDKMWESTSSKFTGAVLSRIAGGSEHVAITRVDKGVHWGIDAKSRTYTEIPIEPFKIKESAKERGEKEKPKVRVTKSEFTVKKTGASETINGFPCEEYLITWLVEMEDIETKAKSRSTMVHNLWTTAETATIRKVQAEEHEFHKAYARKVGLTLSPEETKQSGIEAFASLSGAPPEEIEKEFMRVKSEMAKIKGYPIRSVVNWTLESEKGAASPREEASSEPAPGSPASIGGFLGGLKGRITQKMAGEKSSTPTGKEAPFFSSTMEVRAISADPIPAETFEIPAGYARKKTE